MKKQEFDIKRIKILCAEKGISLAELCRQCDIQPTALNIMLKRNSIKVDKLARIADFFGISVGYFFGEKKNRLPLGELRSLLSDLHQIQTVIDNAKIDIERDIHYLESL